LKPRIEIKTKNGDVISNITELYALLLERGWSKESCASESFWKEENPVVGQSLVTALLVQRCFGGEVFYFKYSNRTHHFNYIRRCYVDLTFDELDPSWRSNYPPEASVNLGYRPNNTYEKHYNKLKLLIENCGIMTISLRPPRKNRGG
jgi:hypothetical protein